MTDKLEFGKMYTIRAKFIKGRHARGDYGGPAWYREGLNAPVDALYIGYRDVHDGDLKVGFDRDYGDYQYFTPSKTYRVYLFVTNERTNPIRVLPEDVIYG